MGYMDARPHMAASGLLLGHLCRLLVYQSSAEEDRFGGGGGGGSYLKGAMYKLILNLNHSDGAFAL